MFKGKLFRGKFVARNFYFNRELYEDMLLYKKENKISMNKIINDAVKKLLEKPSMKRAMEREDTEINNMNSVDGSITKELGSMTKEDPHNSFFRAVKELEKIRKYKLKI